MNFRGARGRALGAVHATQTRSTRRAKVCGSGVRQDLLVLRKRMKEKHNHTLGLACEHLGTPGSSFFTYEDFLILLSPWYFLIANLVEVNSFPS